MPRVVDADKLRERMYHEAFEKDSDLQRWDSGCWIRYKLFEQILADMSTLVTDDLISRSALYYRAAKLEAQALDHVGKLIERDGDEPSVDWRIWSAILNERTAFKHDVSDAVPAIYSEEELENA